MPFIIRSYRRFPMHCPVSYNAGTSQGLGTVWNFSVNGWKLSGDVPLRVGQTCPLTVTLPNQESIFVDAAIVRWVRGQEYGLETLAVDKPTQSRVEQLVHQLKQVALESIE
jgi:PilZ domain